ncbi:MAG: hypothetical protein QGG40_05650 [Myxococcota bacterium]|jgi:hypothetical protein|nr:hypothetical protein [Myxococcota bacterium]
MHSRNVLTCSILAITIGCTSEELDSDVTDSSDGASQGADTGWEPGDDGQDDDQQDDVDDQEEERFQPEDGTWTVTEADLVADGCGLSDYVDRGQPGSTMELDSTSDGFDLTFAGGGETVECAIDGDDALTYACDTVEDIDQTPSEYGLDSWIEVDLTSSGVFDSEFAMYMSTEVVLDCGGDDCAVVELFMGASFPCTMVLDNDFVAEDQ